MPSSLYWYIIYQHYHPEEEDIEGHSFMYLTLRDQSI
jgi:hypothetical protein